MIRTNKALLKYCLSNFAINSESKFATNTYKPGEYIIHQNAPGKAVYIIKDGITKCFVIEENGRNFIQEFFAEGEIVGELEVLTQTTSFSNVCALSTVQAYKIPGDAFMKLLKVDSDFNSLFIHALALKLRETAIRASNQQVHTLEYNLKKLLKSEQQHKIQIPKKDLADYLGITLRSLNRIRKK